MKTCQHCKQKVKDEYFHNHIRRGVVVIPSICTWCVQNTDPKAPCLRCERVVSAAVLLNGTCRGCSYVKGLESK